MISFFIVEDDRLLQDLYAIILKDRAFEIIATAYDGAEAVEKYRSFLEKPDIIIMDYRMPLMNGLDAMRAMKQMSNQQKFIFASADIAIKKQVLSMGAVGFIEKPFKIKPFLDLINKIINKT